MKKIILPFFTTMISIYFTSIFTDYLYVKTFEGLFLSTAIFTILNLLLKPILKFFSFPIRVLSLGLFNFVINGFILYLSFFIALGNNNLSFISCIIASVFISIFTAILKFLMK